jgi:nitroimidazol reductase NimA-like FMN-containing flavoprotein (pyridoxamine 5'-phosphate oxidase superfamily)
MPNVKYATKLDSYDAWERLRSQSFGRLAVSLDGQPSIFPVNFLADDSTILIRTEEGTKVEQIEVNALVAFEVDEVDSARAWSVVVKGVAHRLDETTIAAARRAPLWSWAPEPKEVFLRITPTEVTGRIFTRAR